ncbi:MAG: LysR family transcriptional regulator [Verrucomicrobia bacterium]|nr:LysR family transcriptional regulator [Verrucomicrobiota bacterium]
MNDLIDFRQLKAFQAVMKTGGFTPAAKNLRLSQSAISHAIRSLEEDVGCRLFDRVGKTVRPTIAAEQLMMHAQNIFSEMQRARRSLQRVKHWGVEQLRLGASEATCQFLLPKVLREFRKTFPNCVVSVEPGDTHDIEKLLLSEEIDIGLTLEPARQAALEFTPLFTDELKFIVSKDHPWAKTGRANPKEIPTQQYILYDKRSYTHRLITAHLQCHSISIRELTDLGSTEAIKEMVKLNLGITILAPWVASREIANGALVPIPLGHRKLRRCWGILRPTQKSLNWQEETFRALCKKHYAAVS